MTRLRCLGLLLGVVGFCHMLVAPVAAQTATPDDTARFLAGLPVSAGSPLKAASAERSWGTHAQAFDRAWTELDAGQMKKVRAWAAANVVGARPTLYYMFSGPDFLYAHAFFPGASTYVMSGLELTGPIPDVSKLKGAALDSTLARVRGSMGQILGRSYFITSQMGRQLAGGQGVSGILPVLYIFLARTGHQIRDVAYMQLASDGSLGPYEAAPGTRPRVARITFAGADGAERKLYYFNTDLSNKGTATSGFLDFCAKLGPGDSLIKSASYLLHTPGFTNVRDFLLQHSTRVVQDDTGIRVRDFPAGAWELTPFGNYTGPIGQFRGNFQKEMAALFAKAKPGAMDFGIGYKWRPGQSSILRAVKTKQLTEQPAPPGRG